MTIISIERPKAAAPRKVATPEAARQGRAFEFEAGAKTPAGQRLVELAERLAPEFSRCAGEHDRDGSYPFEAIDALKEVNYFAAPIPEELGGLGVDSIHDLLVASSRLARGDASVTIGVNMHLATVYSLVRMWQRARSTGNKRRLDAIGGTLEVIARGKLVICAATSEPNQDLTRPQTTAVKTDGGWLINGKKIFGTMSPAADMLLISVTFVDESGEEMYGFAMVPKLTPGVILHDDWDALGMRASGSQSISFENVQVPDAALRGGFPAGKTSVDVLERYLTSGPFHASASLGIAEAAHDIALKATSGRAANAYGTMSAAQNAIDLSAMRAIFSRAGELMDAYAASRVREDALLDECIGLFSEVQAAKVFLCEGTQRVVDRALALSGGAGFANKHPLSRLYRDARAGAFMHPLGSNRAYDFIGAVALGLEPSMK